VSSNKRVTASSGNVFADLGFANPEEEFSRPSSFANSAESSNVGSLLRPRRPPCLD
jgi:hypothetical protein